MILECIGWFLVLLVFRTGFRRWFCMVSVVAGKHLFYVSVAGFKVDSAAAGGSIILECIGWFLVFWVFRTGFRRWLFMVSVVAGKHFFCMVSVVGFSMVSVVAGNVLFWFPSLVFFNGFRLLQDRGCLSDGNHLKIIRTFPWRTEYIYIYIYIYHNT